MAMMQTKKWIETNEKEEYAAAKSELVEIIGDFRSETSLQKSISKRMTSAQTEGMIKAVKDKDLYYGVYYDTRGRVYYCGTGLAPQGKDLGRGSLQAKKGRRLGKKGLYFLKLGVANTWGHGLEKKRLEERVSGVDGMVASGELKRLVTGALTGEGFDWRLADEPMQFITLAHDLLQAIESGDVENYVSHVFIGFDATCSGLQILSALAKCEETAQRVNVKPVYGDDGKQVRRDVYLDLAKGCNEISNRFKDSFVESGSLEQAYQWIKENTSGDHWAVYWADYDGGKGIGRAVTKKPCMVYCYGGKTRTFAASIREETNAPWKACMWLAKVMYDDVLAAMLPKAHAVMKWMQDVVKIITSAGKMVEFTTANGLPFRQAVMESKSITPFFRLPSGNIMRTKFQKDTDKIDVRKNTTASAPNFVHHWDGLFLQNAVLEFVKSGIESFFTVHDCFYLLAGDWEDGWDILRREFVNTFEGDVLLDLHTKLEASSGLKLPKPPQGGGLDVASVLDSDFCFS